MSNEVPLRKTLRLVLLAGLLGHSSLTVAQSGPTPGPCQEGVQPGGALWLICIPTSGWNNDLVIWAHGYIAFNQPLDFQHLTSPNGDYLPELVQNLGFAFATTSYRTNGLAVLGGADDIRELVEIFHMSHSTPGHTYLTGASEGGVITTLLVEQSPELFSGALAVCGPIGDFQQQVDYFFDFRVLFDYFFPGAIPGSPINIPPEVIDDWETLYTPAIRAALAANPGAAGQLISASKAPIDRADPSTIESTTLNLLWYNIFATNDAITKFGGNPYGNRNRWYRGSSNDLQLNRQVQRFSADPVALAEVANYETSGNVTIPLVTLHTSGDEIVPFWHELFYLSKVHTQGRGSVTPIPIFRYGHCNFTANEMLAAFGLLVQQVTGHEVSGIIQRFDVEQARRDFARLQRDFAGAQ